MFGSRTIFGVDDFKFGVRLLGTLAKPQKVNRNFRTSIYGVMGFILTSTCRDSKLFYLGKVIFAVVCLWMFKDVCLCRISLSVFWAEEQHMNYLSMISY